MAYEKRLFKTSKYMLAISGLWSHDIENRKMFKSLYNIYSIITQTVYSSCIISFAVAFYLERNQKITEGFHQIYKWKKTISANVTIEKPQAVPFWFPFDKEKHYFLAMSYQMYHIVQTMFLVGSTQALMNSVLVFVKAELKMLQYEAEHFDTFSSVSDNVLKSGFPEKNLRELVIKHQQIIRWVKDFNACFKTIFLLDYCITSLQFATTLIQIIQGVKILFNLTFLIHCFLELLALSWNANEILIESSTGLSKALFNSPWYKHSKYCKFLIRIMIMRCGKPLTMSIGPLGQMNIDMAISRVKLSYTCLSLLQAKTT
ncbi:odorant receptor 10a [Sitophilus oryzae]|uniref:Odorant receptor 10a n=1 Tax=Sitophilus oryzae TaxID=7048 RepID=A0A6J2X4E8_SITOR|nr:odorant receptor 10a [Sitophilus oryzae]